MKGLKQWAIFFTPFQFNPRACGGYLKWGAEAVADLLQNVFEISLKKFFFLHILLVKKFFWWFEDLPHFLQNLWVNSQLLIFLDVFSINIAQVDKSKTKFGFLQKKLCENFSIAVILWVLTKSVTELLPSCRCKYFDEQN